MGGMEESGPTRDRVVKVLVVVAIAIALVAMAVGKGAKALVVKSFIRRGMIVVVGALGLFAVATT